MGASASTIVVAALFLGLYIALLIWRRAESRWVEALVITLLLPANADVERLNELEEKLASAVEAATAGRLDGEQYHADSCSFFFKGASAERLSQIVRQPLREFGPAEGSYLIKRYGAPGAREERVELSDLS